MRNPTIAAGAATALALLLRPGSAFYACPPTGALLPVPKLSDTSLGDAGSRLTQALTALTGSTAAPLDMTTTSFSVTITTAEETVFQYHHTAPKINETGVSQINGDTVYRVASLTKVFVVLAALADEGVDLDDYVWEHVPELVGNDDYKDTTLRILASHISGLPRDLYAFDLTATRPPAFFEGLDFPNVTAPADFPICDWVGLRYCSRAEFFQGLTSLKKVWNAGEKPAYSNTAFIVLGWAIESATNKSLHDIVNDRISRPMNLSPVTGWNPPREADIIIPFGGVPIATFPFENWEYTAGIWSTPNDLARFQRGILNAKTISQVATNAWLKPQAFTSSLTGGSTGAPFGIIRPINVARKSGERPLEIYASLGGAGAYFAYSALIPEYKLGIAINVASPDEGDPTLRRLLDLAVQHAVPELDDLARSQAEAKYAGKYTSADGKSSVVLALDNGPGLKVKEWKINGRRMHEAWMAITGTSQGMAGVDVRVYPIGGDKDDRWEVFFRGIPAVDERDTIFGTNCDTWFDTARQRYAGLLFDDFQFNAAGNGSDVVQGVTIPGFRQTLTKTQA